MTEEYHRSMVFSIHRFIMRLRYNKKSLVHIHAILKVLQVFS